jgi:hypothetical protein
MERGFENKMRPVRTGSVKNENIEMLKTGVNLTEQEILKCTDEKRKLELENTLTELKTKLLKEEIKNGGLKKEDSIGDFDANLDNHILHSEKYEIENKKIELEDEYESIESNPDFSEYFKSETRQKSVQEEIRLLESDINISVKDKITPQKKIEDLIKQLRNYEKENEELEIFLLKEISLKPELQIAIKRMEEISNKIKNLDKKLEKIFKLSESDQNKRNYKDVNTSLN